MCDQAKLAGVSHTHVMFHLRHPLNLLLGFEVLERNVLLFHCLLRSKDEKHEFCLGFEASELRILHLLMLS